MKRLRKSFVVKDENGIDKINTCHIATGIAAIFVLIILLIISTNRLNFWINGIMTTASIENKEALQENEFDYVIRHELDSTTFDINYQTDTNIGEEGGTISIYFLRQKPSKIMVAAKYNNFGDIIILLSILILLIGVFWFGVFNPDFIHDHCGGDVNVGD